MKILTTILSSHLTLALLLPSIAYPAVTQKNKDLPAGNRSTFGKIQPEDTKTKIELALGISLTSEETRMLNAGFSGEIALQTDFSKNQLADASGHVAATASHTNMFCLGAEASAILLLAVNASICINPLTSESYVAYSDVPLGLSPGKNGNMGMGGSIGAHWMTAVIYGDSEIAGRYFGIRFTKAAGWIGGVGAVYARRGSGYAGFELNKEFDQRITNIDALASVFLDLANISADHIIILGYRAGANITLQSSPLEIVKFRTLW